jgi:hypothetical protein
MKDQISNSLKVPKAGNDYGGLNSYNHPPFSPQTFFKAGTNDSNKKGIKDSINNLAAANSIYI